MDYGWRLSGMHVSNLLRSTSNLFNDEVKAWEVLAPTRPTINSIMKPKALFGTAALTSGMGTMMGHHHLNQPYLLMRTFGPP